MKTRALMAAMAASSMVLAPVAAQAGTKAASMTAPISYGNRATPNVDAKKKASGTSLLLLALGLGAAGVGVAAAAGAFEDDGEEDRTPGAI